MSTKVSVGFPRLCKGPAPYIAPSFRRATRALCFHCSTILSFGPPEQPHCIQHSIPHSAISPILRSCLRPHRSDVVLGRKGISPRLLSRVRILVQNSNSLPISTPRTRSSLVLVTLRDATSLLIGSLKPCLHLCAIDTFATTCGLVSSPSRLSPDGALANVPERMQDSCSTRRRATKLQGAATAKYSGVRALLWVKIPIEYKLRVIGPLSHRLPFTQRALSRFPCAPCLSRRVVCHCGSRVAGRRVSSHQAGSRQLHAVAISLCMIVGLLRAGQCHVPHGPLWLCRATDSDHAHVPRRCRMSTTEEHTLSLRRLAHRHAA
jgi:hypothetical protein